LAGLALVLMLAFSGCAGALDARGEKGYATADQASTSASAIGEAEQYRDNCRMQIYIFKEDMNKAEVKDFTARVIYRVQANLNGGDDKNLDELLDDIDVPAYRDLCG